MGYSRSSGPGHRLKDFFLAKQLWASVASGLILAAILGIIHLLMHSPPTGTAAAGVPTSSTSASPSEASSSAGSESPSDSPSNSGSPTPSISVSASPAPHPTGPPAGISLAGPSAPDGLFIEGNDDLQQDANGVSINGTVFADSYEAGCSALCPNPETVPLPLDLGKKYQTIKATFGAADNSPSNSLSASIEVIADGDIIYSRSFSVGQSQVVTLNVSGVDRLTFQFIGDLQNVYPAVGEPTAYG